MSEYRPILETLSVEQIPFDQVENTLGIPRDVFMRHPQSEDIMFALTHLTDGRSMMTPIIEFPEYKTERFNYTSARFSLKKNEQQKLIMIIHPITDQIRFENEFNLSNKEIDQLYRGEIISKEIDLRHDGKLVDTLIQLNPGTNQTIQVPKPSIIIPHNLGQVQQTPQDIQKLIDGGQITITNPEGQIFDVQLCLYSSNMITVSENFDRLRQQSSAHVPQTVKSGIPDVFADESLGRESTQTLPVEERTTPVIKR